MKVLLVLRSLSYLRLFDGLIDELLDRGVGVRLMVELVEEGTEGHEWLLSRAQRPGFHWMRTTAIAGSRWYRVAAALRRTTDHVRFLGLEFADSPYFAHRARAALSRPVRFALVLPGLRGEEGRRRLERWLTALDRGVPVNHDLVSDVRSLGVDVIAVVPHLMPGNRSDEYVKAAEILGIPSVVCVASWDNLSTKQKLYEVPDRVVVWNETQREEAMRIHDVPAERIVITGAHPFDRWRSWQPRPREAFCRTVGLDPDKPYILYLAGSHWPGRVTEAEWSHTWLAAIRRHPALSDVGVLFRPHPTRAHNWEMVDYAGLGPAVVFPCGRREMPVSADARQDFFDSMYHCAAAAGINTTAMIEAAIVGRLVHVYVTPDFVQGQVETPHFRYLMDIAGGLAVPSYSFAEHAAQLAAAVSAPADAGAARAREFLGSFVRPLGVERAATPILADALLTAASKRPTPLQRRVPRSSRVVFSTWLFATRVCWKARLLMLHLRDQHQPEALDASV